MRERIIGVLGSAVGVVVVGGVVFAQCVWPFLRDNDEIFTCDNEEIRAACDSPGTIGNFFVTMCGRDAVRLVAARHDVIDVGGGISQPDPPSFSGTYKCGDRSYLRVDVDAGEEINSYDELKNHVTDGKGVIDIYEAWTDGTLTTEEAKQALLGQ